MLWHVMWNQKKHPSHSNPLSSYVTSTVHCGHIYLGSILSSSLVLYSYIDWLVGDFAGRPLFFFFRTGGTGVGCIGIWDWLNVSICDWIISVCWLFSISYVDCELCWVCVSGLFLASLMYWESGDWLGPGFTSMSPHMINNNFHP